MGLKQINSLGQLTYRSADSRKGSILILALWSLGLLAVFAVYLGSGVRQKLILAHRLGERSKLHFIAEAGAKRAIIELRREAEEGDSEGEDYYGVDARCSNNAAAFKNVKVGDGRFNVSYDYMDEKEGVLTTRYGLSDEEGKININKANQTVLRRLFKVAVNSDQMEAQELAAAILDWRDKDSQLSIPVGSAEDFEYRGKQYSYEAKDDEFEILDELLLVKGINSNIFEKLRDYITIYGKGKVNINTASKVVLLALGLDALLVDKIILYRAGEDGKFGTSDDNVFVARSQIVSRLSQFTHLGESQVAQLSMAVSKDLTANSNSFSVKSVAKLNNRDITVVIRCVIDRDGRILYWQES